ncbi:MAG: AbrB/MazE/SpoVT family DNA-binding domain-containing protein [Candidatus Woesearchaeota archaeon]|jgi:phosphate uptake regulator
MERKVMKQGPSTLVVSLPSNWVKKYGVKKGSTVYLQEKGTEITIAKRPQQEQKKITLNLSNTLPMTHRISGALYKTGFDEITLEYKNSDEARAILESVNVFQGHEIIKHENNTISIKRIAQPDATSFDTLYRKCFHIVEDMANDTTDALQKNNKERMNQVVLKDDLMAVFVNYTIRMIVLGYKDKHSAKYYHIVVQLEKIADRFKYLCRWYAESQHNPSISMITLTKDLKIYLHMLHDLFYNFSLEKVTIFGKERRALQRKAELTLQKIDKKEVPPFVDAVSIISMIFDLNGPIMEINCSENIGVE